MALAMGADGGDGIGKVGGRRSFVGAAILVVSVV